MREKTGKEGSAYVRGKKDGVILTAPTAAVASFLKKNFTDEMQRDPDREFFVLK